MYICFGNHYIGPPKISFQLNLIRLKNLLSLVLLLVLPKVIVLYALRVTCV